MQPNFECLFGIPSSHRLLLLRTRERGGVLWSLSWTHEAVDPSGVVTARYESYHEIDRVGCTRAGWCKYDHAGRLEDERVFVGGWAVQDVNSRAGASGLVRVDSAA